MAADTLKHILLQSLRLVLWSSVVLAMFALSDWLTRSGPEVNGIPQNLMAGVQVDFSRIGRIAAKKTAFFNYLAPQIEYQNQLVAQQREELMGIRDTWQEAGDLTIAQRRVLSDLRDQYAVPSTSFETQWSMLNYRVDELPISLVLAQAANESGWGTSRFAREANNYFGQWCFQPGCGVVPQLRPEGERYEVARFHSVSDSIQSYFSNINSHGGYQSLREIRAQLREMGLPLQGLQLAEGLSAYSSRGDAYVKDIQSLIISNHLSTWD